MIKSFQNSEGKTLFYDDSSYMFYDSNGNLIIHGEPTVDLLTKTLTQYEYAFQLNEIWLKEKSPEFYNQNKKLLPKICNHLGETVLDLAIDYADFKAVKFLVNDCNMNPNIVDFGSEESSILRLLNSLDYAADDFIDKVDILKFLLSKFGFIYNLNDLDGEDENSANRTPENNRLYFQAVSTISSIYNLIYEYLIDLDGMNNGNIDKEYESRVLYLLSSIASLGFLPNFEDQNESQYKKYKLYNEFFRDSDYIFSLDANQANIMQFYNMFYIQEYTDQVKNQIIESNVLARTLDEKFYERAEEINQRFEGTIDLINKALNTDYTFDILEDEDIYNVRKQIENDDSIDSNLKEEILDGISDYVESLIEVSPTIADCKLTSIDEFDEILKHEDDPNYSSIFENAKLKYLFIESVTNLKQQKCILDYCKARDKLLKNIMEPQESDSEEKE